MSSLLLTSFVICALKNNLRVQADYLQVQGTTHEYKQTTCEFY